MTYIIPNCHSPLTHNQHNAPYLRQDINLISLVGLPAEHKGPRCGFFGMSDKDYAMLKNDGFMGLQNNIGVNASKKRCKNFTMGRTVGTIINKKNLRKQAIKWKQQGYQCATILIGNGREDIYQATELAELVLHVSQETHLPLYIELHRGTVTQHIPLVLKLIEQYPGLRFNGDFSHYVTAYRWDEYFDETILHTIQPILQRVRFIQARLSDHNKAQSHQADDHPAWPIFQLLWQQSFKYFKQSAIDGDYFCFTPELLPRFTDYAEISYSSTGAIETGNRYETSKQLIKLAKAIFEKSDHDKDFITAALTKAPTSKQENPPLIYLRYLEDVENAELNDESIIKHKPQVILGTGLETEEEAQTLLKAFEHKNRKVKLLLKIHRGSVLQNPFLALERLKHLDNTPLSMDIAEWILAHEMRPDHLSKLTPIIKSLTHKIQYNHAVLSTAERRNIPKKTPLKLYYGKFCIPTLLTWMYQIYYKKTWKTLVNTGYSDH